MINFHEVKLVMDAQVTKMLAQKHLFVVGLQRRDLWQRYMDAFPEGENELHVKNRKYECSSCHHFINRLGRVVAVNDDFSYTSIWDADFGDSPFAQVAQVLSKLVHGSQIVETFYSNVNFAGWQDESLAPGLAPEFEHFSAHLPERFCGSDKASVAMKRGKDTEIVNTFWNSLQEIELSSVEIVADLIRQNSLDMGDAFFDMVLDFQDYKETYERLKPGDESTLLAFLWSTAISIDPAVATMRNRAIGALMVNITKGDSLDVAKAKYADMVASENYQRSTAAPSKRMADEAREKFEELGLLDAIHRRFAVMDDIALEYVLYANRDAFKQAAATKDPFMKAAEKLPAWKEKKKHYDEIGIEDFITNVLPTATGLEVLLENAHERNMCSLITQAIAGSPSMFKWDTPFALAYKGNLARPSIREDVKSAGGVVDAFLRGSIRWNMALDNHNDYDLWCIPPHGRKICFHNMRDSVTGGHLDLDNRMLYAEQRQKVGVENIYFKNRVKLIPGPYQFGLHNFNHRGGRSGFEAEIQAGDEVRQYSYPFDVGNDKHIPIANVYYDGNGGFTFKDHINSQAQALTLWGLNTQQFHPVTMCLISPNYWGTHAVGNKQYLFMLAGCVNDENPNGFYNEFLRSELRQYRKYLEILGADMAVPDEPYQLSGVGFSATQQSSVVVRVSGSHTRELRIIF